jgi:hypothetical protein
VFSEQLKYDIFVWVAVAVVVLGGGAIEWILG